MDVELLQAGERLTMHVEPRWLDDVLQDAAGGVWDAPSGAPGDVEVLVERQRGPFRTAGWEPLTRGAWSHGCRCVVENACGAGFDLFVDAGQADGGRLQVVARWWPPTRERLANVVLRARFLLLARAVLVQYPVLWWSGRRGRVPLHASALAIDGRVPLLVGPGGVGRSTLVLAAAAHRGRTCSDNIVVADTERVHGLAEPMRVEGRSGRRTTRGRRERELPGRVPDLTPDRIVVLRRGVASQPTVRVIDAPRAARALAAGTYMAGELRRYWPLAATLVLGTGIGPVHPPIGDIARGLADRLPAVEITWAAVPVGDPAALLRDLPLPTAARS